MGFEDGLSDCFPEISARSDATARTADEVGVFVDAIAKGARAFGATLELLAKRQAQTGGDWGNAGNADYPSIARSFQALLDTTEAVGAQFTKLGADLDAIPKQIKVHQQDSKRRFALQRNGKSACAEVDKFEKKVQKARETHDQLQRKANESLDELNKAKSTETASNVAKLSKKSDADAKLAEKAERELQAEEQKLAACFTGTLSPIMRGFEEIEKESIDNTSTYLKSFSDAFAPLAQKLEVAVRTISDVADRVDSAGDLQAFESKKSKGVKRDFRMAVAVLPVFTPKTTADDLVLSETTLHSNGTPPSKSQRIDPPSDSDLQGTCDACVLHGYLAEDENELTLAPGDLIRVFMKDESGWWQGELEGNIGMFPSNFVSEQPLQNADPDESIASTSESVDEGATSWNDFKPCRALYAYEPQDEYDLTFAEGDILYIADESARETGWLFCYDHHRNYGRAPVNYVDEDVIL